MAHGDQALPPAQQTSENALCKMPATRLKLPNAYMPSGSQLSPGKVAEGIPESVQTANVVEALKQAAGVLEEHDITMVCEPLNWRDHHGLFLRFTPQSIAIMNAVDSPSCRILQDIYHQQASEGNLIDHMNAAWDLIPYFQVGDNPGRREPGTGEINYANVFKHMNERGCDAIVGMEHGKSIGGKEGEVALIEAYRNVDPA